MSRVTYGAVITDIKGSIGGITFQSNGNAKIARLKQVRAKKNTSKQSSRISEFQQPLQVWNLMDQAEKDAFTTFAAAYDFTSKWGTVKTLTGFQWFMALGNNALLCGNSVNNSPPTWATPLAVPTWTVDFDFETFNITFSPSFAHTGEHLLIYTSPLLRSVSLLNRKTLRLTKIIAPTTSSTIDIITEWQSVHNTPLPISGGPVDQCVFVAMLTISNTKDLASAFTSDWHVYYPT